MKYLLRRCTYTWMPPTVWRRPSYEGPWRKSVTWRTRLPHRPVSSMGGFTQCRRTNKLR